MKKLVIALVALVAFSRGASASHLTALEPPPGLIVLAGGLEWVYAGPCAGIGGCGDVVLHHGFDFPTAAEWLASFATIPDVSAAFAGKCASPYFNVAHDHCDFGDLAAGFIWHSPLAPSAFHSDHTHAETFLNRGAVPEPASVALLGGGFLALGAVRRRRSKV